MPCIESWMNNPLHAIQNVFEKTTNKTNWSREVEKYFQDRLPNVTFLKTLNSINSTPLHNLQSGSLVHFRCMIQETFEPECFLERYEAVGKKNKNKVTFTSAYRDVIDCPNDYDFFESDKNITGCRQVLYCVTIPGESDWVKEEYAGYDRTQRSGGEASTSGVKRGLEEGNDDTSMEQVCCNQWFSLACRCKNCGSSRTVCGSTAYSQGHITGESMNTDQIASKRHRATNASADHSRNSTITKNHPLPAEDGPVCIVKIYDEDVHFKVNEVYEFVGVLSMDVSLSTISDASEEEMDTESLEEIKAHNPPYSFIPRLHCVTMFKLEHNNPYLIYKAGISSEDIMMETLRLEMLSYLKQATFGDQLTAEYLLMCLTSRVYARTPGMAVGQFSLNISNIPPNTKYPRLLSELIQQLVTKAFYFPMTIENINNLKFIPTKNYTSNRLDSGILQLSDGTYFIADETELKPGMLDANGVKNVKALSFLASFQKVEYDFQYHPLTFDHDVPILVFSEGKSMLGCHYQVVLKPETVIPNDMEEYFRSIHSPPELLEKMRCYLTLARLNEYELKEDMMKIIENDFVASRQVSDANMTPDDLHKHLVVAKLLSVSAGSKTLSEAQWQNVRKLESERRKRLDRT